MRTFSKNEGSISLRRVRIIGIPQNSKTLPIILQRRICRSYTQDLLVPILTEFLEVYNLNIRHELGLMRLQLLTKCFSDQRNHISVAFFVLWMEVIVHILHL